MLNIIVLPKIRYNIIQHILSSIQHITMFINYTISLHINVMKQQQ